MAGLLASPEAPRGDMAALSSLTIFLTAPEPGVRTLPFKTLGFASSARHRIWLSNAALFF